MRGERFSVRELGGAQEEGEFKVESLEEKSESLRLRVFG